ncbi:MAG: hypothetical protein ACYTG7_26210, partial [Planctomycetota bacterium]
GITRTGLNFDSVSGTSSGTIVWSKWDFGTSQGEGAAISYQDQEFVFTEDGDLILRDYPMPALDGEPPGALRYYDLKGTVREDGKMAVVSTTGDGDPPIFAVLYKQGGNHSIEAFNGDYYGLGIFFYYATALEVSSYLEANFDGFNNAGEGGFQAEYTNVFTDGLASGLIEGNYIVGGIGGFEFWSPFFTPPGEAFAGGIMEGYSVAGGTTPKGNDYTVDPGMIFFIERYKEPAGDSTP